MRFKKLFLLLILSSCVANKNLTNLHDKRIISTQNIEQGFDEYNIGLIVPITGTNKNLGQTAIDASLLALSKYEKYYNIHIIDSEQNQEKLRIELENLYNLGVRKFIGPLFSDETKKIAQLLNNKNLEIISLSNDDSIKKDGLYLLGISPSNQILSATSFAISQNIKKYNCLFPNNKYGHKLAEDLENYSTANFAEILSCKFYSNKKQLKSISLESQTTNIQALFVAANDEELEIIASKNDQNSYQIINLQPIKSKNRDFSGIWYLSTDLDQTDKFNSLFYNVYRYKPTRIASLSYDATEISLGKVIKKHHKYSGSNGFFSFDKDGIAKYDLMVYQID